MPRQSPAALRSPNDIRTLALAACLASVLAAASPVARAATTTVNAGNSPYTVPGNTVASGDVLIVENGGSLSLTTSIGDPNPALSVIGELEFTPTLAGGAMNLFVPIGGTGPITKSGNGRLNVAGVGTAPRTSGGFYTGDWTLEDGIITTVSDDQSQKMFGTGATLILSGGFVTPILTNSDFSVDHKETVITSAGGGFDFTQITANLGIGTVSIEGPDGGVGRRGITGTGTFTIRGLGTPQSSGFSPPPFVFFTGSGQTYSGSTILDGGLFVLNPSTMQAGSSPFGTSTVTLEDGATLSANFGNISVSNDIVLGTGGGQTQALYNNPGSYRTAELTGVVSGTGSFTNVSGYAKLSAANTFTGDTRLGSNPNSVLQLNHVSALAGSTLDMNAADNGSLELLASNTYYKLGGLKGSRTLVQQGTQANVAVEIGANNQDTTFTGNFGVQGFRGYDGIIKSGTGTLTLTGTYFTNTSPLVSTPGMQVTAGTLAVNSDLALGANLSDGQANTVAVTLNGGTLKQSLRLTLTRPIALGTSGGALDTTTSGASDIPAFNGLISGTGSLELIANGDLTGNATGGMSLGGSNTFIGTTTITAGMVQAQSSFGNAANQLVLDGGGIVSAGTQTNSYATQIGQATGTLRAARGSDVLNQAGVVSGSGGLRISGGGAVNLQVANTFAGSTRVLTGTLNLAHANALQSSLLDLDGADSGTVGFTAGTTTYNVGGLQGSRNLAFSAGTLSVGTNNQSTAYSGVLSGTGGLAKAGTGTLNLSGANSYSGGTTVSAGTLAGDATSLQGAITNNAAVEFDQATSGTYAGSMGGSGSLTKTGAGALTMSGTSSYGGGSTVSAGRLIGTTSSLQGAIANNAAVEFAQATAGTYGGAMTGSGSLTKSGIGALALTAASSFAGVTDVTAGTLVVNADNSGATGRLAVASGATLAGSGTHGGAVALNAGSTLSPGNSPGTITAASGTWAGGANYNWQVFDAAGTVGTSWDLFNVTGGLDITATSGSPFLVNLWTLSGTGPDVNGSASNFNSNASYSWRMATAAGGVTGFAANKFTVNTAATNGAAGFANAVGSGQFSVANVGNDVNLVFTPAVVFNVTSGTQTQTQQGADANMATAVSVTKTGAGTVVMNGNNTYSAATAVNGGSMIVTGTLANSAVNVAAGATLGGDGLVGALATIANLGTLSPGAAPTGLGILELGGLSLGSSATTVLAITGTTPGADFDQVSILSGPLALGGTLDLAGSNIDGATVGTSYQLFNSAVTPTGNFGSLTALGGIYSGITWSGPVGGVWTSTNGTGGNYLTFTEGTGTLAVVPEPSTLALIGLALAGLAVAAHRRR